MLVLCGCALPAAIVIWRPCEPRSPEHCRESIPRTDPQDNCIQTGYTRAIARLYHAHCGPNSLLSHATAVLTPHTEGFQPQNRTPTPLIRRFGQALTCRSTGIIIVPMQPAAIVGRLRAGPYGKSRLRIIFKRDLE